MISYRGRQTKIWVLTPDLRFWVEWKKPCRVWEVWVQKGIISLLIFGYGFGFGMLSKMPKDVRRRFNRYVSKADKSGGQR